MKPLHKPIAIFDAGIGSYAAVDWMHRQMPRQDILYLADRASFPYGAKSRAALLETMRATLRYLATFDPAAILLASNAPSITVLDDLHQEIDVPIFGVRPPIREALDLAGARDVAVLGVRSLVESPELQAYANAQAGDAARRVHFVDASAMVERVESGQFLFDPLETQVGVDLFVETLNAHHPDVGCLTLSSTHLPWLRSFFEKACPRQHLLDPLHHVISNMADVTTAGSGTIFGLVTESADYALPDFRRMLDRLGVTLDLQAVVIPAQSRSAT